MATKTKEGGTKVQTAGTKVQVVNHHDKETGDWIATSRSPRLEVRGLNAGSSMERINSLLRKHFGAEPYEVIEKIVMPPELQARVDDMREKLELHKQLAEQIETLRLPLAKDMQRAGLMQKQAAEAIGVTPTWLASISRQHDTDPNNKVPRIRK